MNLVYKSVSQTWVWSSLMINICNIWPLLTFFFGFASAHNWTWTKIQKFWFSSKPLVMLLFLTFCESRGYQWGLFESVFVKDTCVRWYIFFICVFASTSCSCCLVFYIKNCKAHSCLTLCKRELFSWIEPWTN